MIEAFYPGQGGASAILEAIFGERNSWGKLPYTMSPATFAARDIMNFDLRADGGLTYRHYNGSYGEPVYRFGHGLSYTTFSYHWATLPHTTIQAADLATGTSGCFDCSRVTFSVTVSNKGALGGDAVVLGFAVAPDGVRSLFDFGRVYVAAGSSITMTLAMDRGCTQAVTTVDDAGVRWITPGNYTVEVGDIVAPARHTFAVQGAASHVSPSCR
mmetsp:Transcript_10794/g.27792  ORF Transcript_10794/g.27792 Transcript_10794/m.27792 type:complete len:214 (-) Transcript_10794:2-643(-)